MVSSLNPRDRFIRQAARISLTIGFLGTGLATLLHRLTPAAHPLNLFIPPILCVGFMGLLVCLYWKPDRLPWILWAGFFLTLSGIVIPIWFFTYQATISTSTKLIETLPPLTSVPLPLIVAMFVFLPPRRVVLVSIAMWFIVALPILLYLVCHPQELWSPRGLEMAITLGPVMMMILVLIPFNRSIEQKIKSLQRGYEEMQILSERDPLTQLYNRRVAENCLTDWMATATPQIGLILFDIDHFKQINDRHGHAVGDLVLRQVAQRCAAILRKDDVLVRWGGEEFLVIIQGVGGDVISGIAEELRQVIAAEPIAAAGPVTASFGVTQLSPTDTIDLALQRVDAAMYAAKHAGRNQVITQLCKQL